MIKIWLLLLILFKIIAKDVLYVWWQYLTIKLALNLSLKQNYFSSHYNWASICSLGHLKYMKSSIHIKSAFENILSMHIHEPVWSIIVMLIKYLGDINHVIMLNKIV